MVTLAVAFGHALPPRTVYVNTYVLAGKPVMFIVPKCPLVVGKGPVQVPVVSALEPN